MKNHLLFLLLTFFHLLNGFGQSQVLKKHRFPQWGNGRIRQIIPQTSGGYWAVFQPSSGSNSELLNLKDDFSILWHKPLDTLQAYFISQIVNDEKGNAWALATKRENDIVSCAFFSIQADGKIVKTCTFPTNIVIHTLTTPFSSDNIQVGFRSLHESQTSTVGLAKCNTKGKWEVLYQTSLIPKTQQTFPEFLQRKDGTYVLGYISSVNPDSFTWEYYISQKMELHLLHLDQAGKTLKTFTKEVESNNALLYLTGAQSMFFAYSQRTESAKSDIILQKISFPDSVVEWEQKINIQESDGLISIHETSHHTFLLSSIGTGGPGNVEGMSVVFELSADGTPIMTHNFRDGFVAIGGIQRMDSSYVWGGYFTKAYVQEESKEKPYFDRKEKENTTACIYESGKNDAIIAKTWESLREYQPYGLWNAIDDGYFIVGIDFESKNLFVVKTDKAGNLLWQQFCGTWSASLEVPISLRALQNGGCVVVTNTEKQYEFDMSGRLINKQIIHSIANISNVFQPSEKEHLYIGAEWAEYPQKNLKLSWCNEKGENIKSQVIKLSNIIEPWDAVQLSNGDYVVLSEWGEIGSTQMSVACITAEGKVKWEKVHHFVEKAYAGKIVILPNGGFAISGTAFSSENKYQSFVLVMDSLGNEKWRKTLVKGDHEIANSLVTIDKNQNIIVAATHKYSSYKCDHDIYLASFSLDGTKNWEKIINGNGSYFTGGLCISPDNQIVITGHCNYQHTLDDEGAIFLKIIRNQP